jgi:ATP-dependent Clp protease ATP-binding subunit ClpB
LDEVEKAHPDVFNILLQVLDDGRLTDGQGRTVDFRNTVIVMTSNLGSDRIQEMHAESEYDAMKSAVLDMVSSHFRPEFINRIDDLIVFHPLEMDYVAAIAQIQIALLASRLTEQGVSLELADGVLVKLAEIGFDPVYGARPLKRAIQQELENPLAQLLLGGELAAGSVIEVTLDSGADSAFGFTSKSA